MIRPLALVGVLAFAACSTPLSLGPGVDPSIPDQRSELNGVVYYDPAWPLASGWVCTTGEEPLTPHHGEVSAPKQRVCKQPEVDALVYGKPWPTEPSK